MTAKEQQLTELLTLTSRSITHLTAAMTSLSFDLLRSSDPGVRGAGSRMVVRSPFDHDKAPATQLPWYVRARDGPGPPS